MGVDTPTASRRRVPRRDAQVVVGAMVVLAVLAWAYVVWMPVDGMTRGILARTSDAMAMDDSMAMDAVGWAASLPFFLVMWVVMMVAMMFPAVSPVVLIFDRWRRSRERPAATTVGFIAGYLIAWTLAGVVAFAIVVLFDTQLQGMPNAVRIGGAVLIVAGVYQFTPLKRACLTQCRSPLTLIMENAQRLGRGVRGPLEVGLRHGAYCLGCCWALMAVLIALGVMHVGWMAAVAAVILAEKVLPGGRVTAAVIGACLVVAGSVVITTGIGVVT
ncbi:MAG: DUF2182 domain-containing protein [Aeromicrobium sp.]